MEPTRMNRRHFAFASAAALLPATLIAPQTMARISESHTTIDGFAEITWNPNLWKSNDEIFDKAIILHDLDYEKYGDDTYYLSIKTTEPVFGDAPPEEALDIHIEHWFSQGMLMSEIVDRWVTDTSCGYLFVSGVPHKRTFIVHDFRQFPANPGAWVSGVLIVDQVLFDEETTATMLDGVEINGEQLISERSTDDLIELFVEHFDLER